MVDTTRADSNIRGILTVIIIISWLTAIGYGIITEKLDFPTAMATLAGPAGAVLGYWFGLVKPQISSS